MRKKLSEEEKKSKITVNINENLLQKFDELLKTKAIKRSTFIEKLLTEYINKQKD